MQNHNKRLAGRWNLVLMGILAVFSFSFAGAQTPQCGVQNAKVLTPPCFKPYNGAAVGAYTYQTNASSDWIDQLRYFESWTNPNGSPDYYPVFAHAYNSPAALAQNPPNSLSDEEMNATNGYSGSSPYGTAVYNQLLLVDWHPVSENPGPGYIAYTWADAGCETANCEAVDKNIITPMANSIMSMNKGMGPSSTNPLFLALGDEPQIDITANPTAPYCANTGGNMGSPSDYIAMWRHIHDKFQSLGVTNVVWVLIYQSDPSVQCFITNTNTTSPIMTTNLYPGDSYVDWIAADIYDDGNYNNPTQWHTTSGPPGIGDQIYSTFSNYFTNKPWMVSEFNSTYNFGDAENVKFYKQVAAGVDDKTFPNFQAYLVFDSMGARCNQILFGGTSATGQNGADLKAACAQANTDQASAAMDGDMDLATSPDKKTTYINQFVQNKTFTDYGQFLPLQPK